MTDTLAWTGRLAAELQRLRHVARAPVPADLHEVTRVAPDEISAAAAGLDAKAAARIWEAAEQLFRTGLFPALGLCVLRDGRPLLDRTLGWASGCGPGAPPGPDAVLATPQTPMCVFSASKAITATVIHGLDDRGLLHVDDCVAEYIPEFAAAGKERVTIRHVLTHRAGLPSLRADDGLDLLLQPDEVLRRLCAMSPASTPGRRLAYHAITGGFILGEIVRRVTGHDIQTALREDFTRPLGLDALRYGWFDDRHHEVARSWFTGPGIGWPIRGLARTALGIDFDAAPDAANSAAWLRSVVPAGNIVGTSRQVARFFDMLRCDGELDGVRVLRGRTVRRATIETSWLEVDFTLLAPIRYGMGFMLGGPRISLFGPDTDRAFGHLGFTNVFCWADPARRISVVLNTTGKPLFSDHILTLARLLKVISVHIPPG